MIGRQVHFGLKQFSPAFFLAYADNQEIRGAERQDLAYILAGSCWMQSKQNAISLLFTFARAHRILPLYGLVLALAYLWGETQKADKEVTLLVVSSSDAAVPLSFAERELLA
jgi:hypothetical protein